jgi:hypothetical protein
VIEISDNVKYLSFDLPKDVEIIAKVLGVWKYDFV